MLSSLPRRIAATVAASVAILGLGLAASASAATSKYPPNAAARGFAGDAGGWTSSSANEGICLPPLLCASVENSFQGTGGADGGGFIRSAYTGVVGVTAVGGTSTGTWESPQFTYTGAGGDEATSVSLASTAAPASTTCSRWRATRPSTRCA